MRITSLQKIAVVLLSVLFTYGCMVSSNQANKKPRKSTSEKGIGTDGKTSTTQRIVLDDDDAPTFNDCLAMLDFHVDHTDYDGSLLAKSYTDKKSCVWRVSVGFYASDQRKYMEGIGVSMGRGEGSFADALSFLNKHAITCERKENSDTLVLVFPVGSRGHHDYDRIELSCANSDRMEVSLGMYDKYNQHVAVTTRSEKEERADIYHAFDTDGFGVIEKHVKVIKDVSKKVLLDDYKLQN